MEARRVAMCGLVRHRSRTHHRGCGRRPRSVSGAPALKRAPRGALCSRGDEDDVSAAAGVVAAARARVAGARALHHAAALRARRAEVEADAAWPGRPAGVSVSASAAGAAVVAGRCRRPRAGAPPLPPVVAAGRAGGVATS